MDVGVPEGAAVGGGAGVAVDADVAGGAVGEGGGLEGGGGEGLFGGEGEGGAVEAGEDLVAGGVGDFPVDGDAVDVAGAAEVDLPPLVVGEGGAPAGAGVAVVAEAGFEAWLLDAGCGRRPPQRLVLGTRPRGRDPADRAAVEVGVEEVSVRSRLEVDRPRRGGDERRARSGVREAVGAAWQHPDALARVVGEEERARVGRRIRAALVEGDAGHRRASARARLAGDDLLVVAVPEVRVPDGPGAGRVQALAQREVGRVVAGLACGSLVARPAEVEDGAGARRDPVQLLDGVPADVAQPHLVRAGPDREPEGIAEAVRDQPALVRVGGEGEGVVRQPLARRRIEAEQGPVQAQWIAAGAEILRAQRAALRRRVAAHVRRAAALAVVGECEARGVAGAHVQRAVGPERQRPHGVARVLLAPVLDQDVLAADHHVPRGFEPREPGAGDAAAGRRARRGRARVGEDARGAPARREAADRGVMRVEHVDVGRGREAGVEGQADKPAVPVVVDVGAQVGEERRRRVADAVVDVDPAALLRHEDAAVGSKADRGRVGEPAPDRGLGEPCREGRGFGARSEREPEYEHGDQHRLLPQSVFAHQTPELSARALRRRVSPHRARAVNEKTDAPCENPPG